MLPRRDRQGCEYEAYIPDPLADRTITLDGATAADVAEAESAVVRLNLEARSLVNSEALARILLRAEAVASSRIEGLEVGSRRLLKAQAARGIGDEPSDVTAIEVLNNLDAMAWAIEQLSSRKAITTVDLLAIHRRLLAGTRLEEHGGSLRTEQNWIGGSDYNPCSAGFVPPPPEYVERLLEDLCAFCNDDTLPAIAQAAIAHAQFETIHPFIDGNGRTGRALIHVVLRRRGLVPNVVPPVSLVLATWSKDYVEGLMATRYRGPADSAAARDGLNRWMALFATAMRRAVNDAQSYEARVRAIQEDWRARLGRVRSGSALELLIEAMPGAPLLSAQSAASLISRSEQAVNEAIPRLLGAGILSQTTVGRRNRAFEAPDLIDAFTDLERRLASPEGDTRSSAPARPAPRRWSGGRAGPDPAPGSWE
ncbi:MAG: Fic family protein [Candidatus Dormibacteraeota bacterium]|nr:Fic family protein [Candidatus Dormibacteraeota bacterium]